MDEELLKKILAAKETQKELSDEDIFNKYKETLDPLSRREKAQYADLTLTPAEKLKIGDDRYSKQAAAMELLKERGYHQANYKGPRFKNKATGKVLKSIPYLGGLLGAAAALQSRDASSAIPILNEAESLGPIPGSEDALIEDPSIPTPERMRRLKALMQNGKKE